MIKAHKKFRVSTMRRTYRIFLNDVNQKKTEEVTRFLYLCHDMTQYFIDMFWSQKDFSSKLANTKTLNKGRIRFGTMNALTQSAAKQAKEIIRSTLSKKNPNKKKTKPNLHNHFHTIYSKFGRIEPFTNPGFDYTIILHNSGVPEVILPFNSDRPLNEKLNDGWTISNSFRLGLSQSGRLYVEVIVEKPTPDLRTEGSVIGMDSNYKQGLVFSNGTVAASEVYPKIQTFSRRQKNTHKEIDSMFGAALNNTNFDGIKVLVIEDLKYVKSGKRGTFSRRFNSRLSHWLYAKVVNRIVLKCEELGIRLERKFPAYTSQYCSKCNKWDRRSRVKDRFKCVHCGHTDDADHNAAINLELLGTTGFYGIRELQAKKCVY